MRIAVYYLQTEVVTMIYRPLYVEKIMAYVDTPFVKILTGVAPLRKVNDPENDYGEIENTAEYSG